MELLFFYIFAGVAIGSAVMVVTNKNVLHAALFLILTFFCVSAIYVILRAEFLAAIQIPLRRRHHGPVYLHHPAD